MDCDVLVIGSGILGICSAFYLKKNNPNKRVLVIDKLGSSGQGNSAKSEGAFRNVFTSRTNYLLADTTIDALSHFERDLGYDLHLDHISYLWLLSVRQYRKLRDTFELISSQGVELKTFEKEDLNWMIPDLVTDFHDDEDMEFLGLEPVEVGVQGVKCGGIDADALVKCYEQEFLKLGGEVLYNTEAKKLVLKPVVELEIPGEPLVWQDSQIVGAETSRGFIGAETTIVATGAWAEGLLNPIGVDPLMRPKKRQIFVFKDPNLSGLFNVKNLNEQNILPLTVLPKAGVYLKGEPSEGSIWVGCADNLGRSFGHEEDPRAEEDYYTDNIYHVLVKYLPCFENIRPTNMWAGHYAINSFDGSPIVLPVTGMIYVGAASGSGIMKCDALGRIVSSIYAGEEEAELYGGHRFKVADLGILTRNVDNETFII